MCAWRPFLFKVKAKTERWNDENRVKLTITEVKRARLVANDFLRASA